MNEMTKWAPFRFSRHTSTKEPVARGQNESFDRMNREMNQLMRAFFGDDEWLVPTMRAASRTPAWFGNYSPRHFSPLVDVTDSGSHLVVSAELPGLDKKDIELTFHEGTLFIKGEKRQQNDHEENGCYRTERFYGSFQRTVPLPSDVQAEGIEAQFDKGVLTVKLPKVPEQTREPRRIEF